MENKYTGGLQIIVHATVIKVGNLVTMGNLHIIAIIYGIIAPISREREDRSNDIYNSILNYGGSNFLAIF